MTLGNFIKIIDVKNLTSDVVSLRTERPREYSFVEGQYCEVGFLDRKIPLTIASTNNDDFLEFVFRVHSNENSLTKRISALGSGGELFVSNAKGSIGFFGEGIFIAGGTGITPFLSIFRNLSRDGKLLGNELIFSNKNFDAIVCREELEGMRDLDKKYVLTRENRDGFYFGRIDIDFLSREIKDFSKFFYICGPLRFVGELTSALIKLGADADKIIVES